MQLQTITPRWTSCIVAATGPSLTEEVAAACQGQNIIAVNDAYRRLPFAQVVYACDARWWKHHDGCKKFAGEKWSSHGDARYNNKIRTAEIYGVNLVSGRKADGFSLNESVIHYGENSGFQAINLAILFGCTTIVLVGFDMNGKSHFFGDHPESFSKSVRYERFIPHFIKAASKLPAHIKILNATPGSSLNCFPKKTLPDCLSEIAAQQQIVNVA